ncbi:MAG: hypothetical protein ACI4MG_01235 [Aristaeellaceae bacterium]
MLKALRLQVNTALQSVPARRKPALRRSDAPDALLATDLPLAADANAVAAFIRALTGAGWRVWQGDNGWLLLDVPVPAPEHAPDADADGECGCCLTLLTRHPDTADATELIRLAVKAADAGRKPFERLCAWLHGELAVRLRRKEPLPGALRPYLARAYDDLYGRESK